MDTRINSLDAVLMDKVLGMINSKMKLYGLIEHKVLVEINGLKTRCNLFYSKGKAFTFNLEDVRENEIESTQKRWHKEIKIGMIPTKKEW